MDELYVEEFSSPLVVKKEIVNTLQSEEKSTLAEPNTAYGHFLNLEKAILDECRRPEMLLPYLKEIQQALNKGNQGNLLKLTDELEELLDIDLFSP